ncbi:sigma-70 family RNA polymerase sigma factor [Actinoplanes sp. NPDC048791]|uniref:sigma-70 family RNA polymerase sigma factor n=1 Tax=Actinoplanes sp. NPDC048791 TaxID=3154623 RepID=UPI0033D4A647
MLGGNHEEAFSALDDLDCAAAEYASAWKRSDAKRRRLLRDDLIRRLIPFADRLASRYRECTEPLEDIRQVARMGLVKAVDRYDPERGSFTAFAFVTITGEVKRHFRDRTWVIHVTRRLQDLSLDVGHATAELTQALSRTPTAPEIARHLEVGEQDVRSARMCTAGRTPISLNTPLGDDGSRELSDLIGSSDEALETIAERLALDDVLRELPPQIQRLIILRFYGNLTQSQIAAEFGISQMHVSRLLHRGLAWLRAALLSDRLPLWDQVQDYHDPENIKVQLRETSTSIDVQVDGEITMHNADRLSRRLHSAVSLAVAQGRLTVDLTGVPSIDTTGATMLRDAQTSASLSQVAMTIVGLPPGVESGLARSQSPTTGPAHR